MKAKIAVIGAGISGLTVAKKLQQNADITVFDKSRGVGGRIATRYTEQFCFDHGAQFLKCKDESFKEFLSPLLSSEIIIPWNPSVVTFDNKELISLDIWNDVYIAVPKMNQLCKSLAECLDVKLNKEVVNVENYHGKWRIFFEDNTHIDDFDWVISTAPAVQALNFLPHEFSYFNYLTNSFFKPCFALLLGYNTDLKLSYDFGLIKNSKLQAISVNSNKPGRKKDTSIVVHACNDWSMANIEQDRSHVTEDLLNDARIYLGDYMPVHIDLHLWRYALAKNIKEKVHIDEENKLAVCGDWCNGSSIEHAYINASHTASQIIDLLS